MGSDGGLDVRHSTIKKARDALTEALEDLAPGSGGGAAAPVAFPEGGAVAQLSRDYAAMGGAWPAAQGFRMSFANAQTGVTTSYGEIVTMLNAAVNLLNQAYKNYGSAEEAGSGPGTTA